MEQVHNLKTITQQNSNINEINHKNDSKKEFLKDLGLKVFVGGIPFNITEGELSQYFCQFGQVNDVKLAKNHIKKKLKGYAFVTFNTKEALLKCLKHKNHRLNGKAMGIKEAKKRSEAIVYSKNLQNLKLFAKGFPKDTNEQSVYELFSEYGNVERVQMQFNPKDKKFKGFCYIIMSDEEDYNKLLELGKIRYQRAHLIQIHQAMSKSQVKVSNRPLSDPGNAFEDKDSEFDELKKQRIREEQRRRHSSYVSKIPAFNGLNNYIFLNKEKERRESEEPKIKFIVYEKEIDEFRVQNLRIGDHNLIWKNDSSQNILKEEFQAIRMNQFTNIHHYGTLKPKIPFFTPTGNSEHEIHSHYLPNLKVSTYF